MAVTLNTFCDNLQTRLRIGTGEVAISRANLTTIACALQATLNYAFKRLVSTGTFTPGSSATCLHSTTATVAADVELPLALYESTRTVMHIPSWTAIQQYDTNWRTTTGTRAEAWSAIGHSLLAVYPAIPAAVTYNCVYVKSSCAAYTTASSFELPDSDIDLISALSEVTWLTTLGYQAEAAKRLEQFLTQSAAWISGPGDL